MITTKLQQHVTGIVLCVSVLTIIVFMKPKNKAKFNYEYFLYFFLASQNNQTTCFPQKNN